MRCTRTYARVSIFAVLVLASASTAVGRELLVGPTEPYRSPSAALAVARDGDLILVRPGVYADSTLYVNRRVVIEGQGMPVLDGEGDRPILIVSADGVVVRGLVFRNVGVSFVEDRAAIKVDGASDCLVAGNRFENNFFGVYLARTQGCVVERNVIIGKNGRESQSGNGIHLWYSRGAQIRDNRISGHRDGIYLEFVEDSELTGNLSAGNLRYGLHFMFSDRCRYVGNRFVGNDAGVAVMYSKNVEMLENTFARNEGSAAYGLLLKEITDSRIQGNVFAHNTIGLFAEGSNRVEIASNVFEANGWAVKIMANSEDNAFNANHFLRNTFDVSTNSRQNYSTFRGNYWDRYRGYDLDADGTGDVPFRPVKLFSLIVEQNEPSLMLLRSPFIALLDAAEAVIPALTPETLVDEAPLMRPRS